MSRTRTENTGRSVLGYVSIVVFVLIALACRLYLSVRFKTASMDEIGAKLPAELLMKEPEKKPAQDRYLDLVEMIPRLDLAQVNEVCGKTLPDEARYRNALDFWRKNPGIESKILVVLKQGPIQRPSKDPPGSAIWLPTNPIAWFSKLATASSTLYAS